MLKKIVKKVVNHKSPLDAYRFSIDKVSDTVISGWAHKIGDGNYAANIEIRNNNVILYTTTANVAREDLKAAAIGTGQYGFAIDPSKIELEQSIHHIDIFIDGLKANAKPLSLTLLATKLTELKQVLASKETTTTNQKSNDTHQMYIDKVSVEKVIGWAKKKDSVSHRSLVELKVGNIVIGSDTADTFRQSIKNAGIGDGCYCFEINPTVHLFPATTVNCDLYIDGNKASITPIELTVTEKAFESARFAAEFSDELSTFGDAISQELQRLNNEISSQNGNAINVAIENIASLSVRVEVIENILTKHFSKK
jgi:hypothetical protein